MLLTCLPALFLSLSQIAAGFGLHHVALGDGCATQLTGRLTGLAPDRDGITLGSLQQRLTLCNQLGLARLGGRYDLGGAPFGGNHFLGRFGVGNDACGQLASI